MKEINRQDIEDIFCMFMRLTSIGGLTSKQAVSKIMKEKDCTKIDVDAAIQAYFEKLSKEMDETGDFTMPKGLIPKYRPQI